MLTRCILCFQILALLSGCSLAQTREYSVAETGLKFADMQSALENYLPIESVYEEEGDFAGDDLILQILSHLTYGVYNESNHSAYILQHNIVYVTLERAIQRYNTQYDVIYVREFRMPPRRHDFLHEELALPEDLFLNADDHYVACVRSSINKRCTALLRYNNGIIIIDSMLIIENIVFLSDQDFVQILSLIDEAQKPK